MQYKLFKSEAKAMKAAAFLYADLDSRINDRAGLETQIRTHSKAGQIKIVESGMDCDCNRYTGKVHVIQASAKAYWELMDRLSNWADGPFSLRIVPFDTEITYSSRDLAAEAFENGHAHIVYA